MEAEFGKFWVTNLRKRQVVADRYLSALVNYISILYYSLVEDQVISLRKSNKSTASQI